MNSSKIIIILETVAVMKGVIVLLVACWVTSTYAGAQPRIPLTDPRASFPSDTFGCAAPDCDTTHGSGKLWPHADPQFFYQCAPGGPVVQRCGAGTLFGFYHQVCIHTVMWDTDRDHCGGTGPPVTDPPGPVPPVTDPPGPVPPVTDPPGQEPPGPGPGPGTPEPGTPGPGLFDCQAPDCNLTVARQRLWPHANPENFYQCAPGGPVVQRCGVGTLFGFFHQVCIHTVMWNAERDHC